MDTENSTTVATPCLIWEGRLHSMGYGVLSRHGKEVLAHRAAYERANGPISPGKFIMHTCDNPPCVNPEHLRAGTPADNAADMKAKGRASRVWKTRGEDNPKSILCETVVRAIREDYATGAWTLKELAKKYATHFSNISLIVRRRTWKHVV